jgi:protease I
MAKQELAGIRVAIIAADGFEQVEVTRPRDALLKQGAEVEIVSLRPGSIQGMNLLVPGKKVKVDRTVFKADPADYGALLIPGGFISPDFLRQSEHVLDFVREFDRSRKPVAAICHGPWVLISAGLVPGRRLTSWPGIQDDVRNAGGRWEDKAVVVDGSWMSSRGPQDLPRFNKALIEHFSPSRTAKERGSSIPIGSAVAGGIALAAVGYGLHWLEQTQGQQETP